MALGFVRPARPGDAAGIARLQVTTWRTAYRRLIPHNVLDQLDQDWITRRWQEAISAPPSPEHRVVVAIEQAENSVAADGPDSAYLVGFAASGPADDAALAPGEAVERLGGRVAAVTDLLVEPRWGRRGHGSRLLAASVDLWRDDGHTTALAWTFADDPATRGFLTAAGWGPDGASRALDVDDRLVPQIRWHASIGNNDNAEM